MNIFATSKDPEICATWLDDLRKNKMILESAQMLSTAIRILEPAKAHGDLYKATHENHPSNVWVRSARMNFVWLIRHTHHLYEQKGPTRLSQSGHKAGRLIPTFVRFARHGSFPAENITPIPNCAANAALGISFKHIADTQQAYRLYLNERWRDDLRRAEEGNRWNKPPVWTRGERPAWADFDLQQAGAA